ncbi:hypothetical protein Avbf_08168 [Armadillidium vulgare]|nr:hypothetical protein Avbf_08168 [Armadillidium vulgare]
MDIKKEVGINDNFLKNADENDDTNDYTFEEEPNPKLEENQNHSNTRISSFSQNMDVKEEIDVKDEPLDFEEEDVEKNQFFEHISGLDESQRMKFFLNLDIKDEVEIKHEPLEFCEGRNWRMVKFLIKFQDWMKVRYA